MEIMLAEGDFKDAIAVGEKTDSSEIFGMGSRRD